MDTRKIPHSLLVKEMFSVKNDEIISGSRVAGWGHLPHVRKEDNAQLHFPSGTDAGPCISSPSQKKKKKSKPLFTSLEWPRVNSKAHIWHSQAPRKRMSSLFKSLL